MKKFFLFCIFASSLMAQPLINEAYLDISWEPGVRLGAGIQVSDNLAIKADIGSNIFSLNDSFTLTYDLCAVLQIINPADFISEPKDHWGLDAHLGLLDAFTVMTANVPTLLVAGVSAAPYFRFNESWKIGARLGAGIPIGINTDNPGIGIEDGIFPDMAISLGYCF